MRVAFVCSNDTHVHTLAPVARYLARAGGEPILVPLDALYAQGADKAARATDLPVATPQFDRSSAAERFYDRPTPAVWRDVLAARRPLSALLTELAPSRIVVGNDSGLVEKLMLTCSRRLGVPVRVLVQDGRLISAKLRPAGLGGRARRTARRAFSPLLRGAGLPYLAASEYGEGGAELVCAAGRRSAELLRTKAGPATRVLVTGQPRYDRLLAVSRAPTNAAIALVAVFTTPFAAARLGAAAQRAQLSMVASLRAALSDGARLVVKPHPREAPEAYAAILGSDGVWRRDPAELLARADVAVVGASTILEEAAIVGCPVVVPGRLVHGDRFEAALPEPSAFPRFDTVEQAKRLLRDLQPNELRAAAADRQRAHVLEDVAFRRGVSAAQLVADVIVNG